MRVIINFSPNRYNDSDLVVKSNTVADEMTDNPNFVNPSPTPASIKGAAADFLFYTQKATGGSHEDVAFKRQKRKRLEDLLQHLAIYVNQTAKGDEAMLISSGFDLIKKPEPAKALPAPEKLKIKPGKSKGSLQLSCSSVAGARVYGFEYRLTDRESENDWARVDSTKHNVLVTGLISGKQYAFRVLAIGSNPQRNWSDEVNSFVL